ncbi:MAG: hypothetical protein ACREAW_01300 [Nitrososphaera sp.]
MTLQTILARIPSVPNETNAALLSEFHNYMKKTGASEHHQKNELYANILFANHLSLAKTFFDIAKKDDVIAYLNTKKKPNEIQPDEQWITTWNDYLGAIKHFYRWLYNQRSKEDLTDPSEWETPGLPANQAKKDKAAESVFRDRDLGPRRASVDHQVCDAHSQQGGPWVILGS